MKLVGGVGCCVGWSPADSLFVSFAPQCLDTLSGVLGMLASQVASSTSCPFGGARYTSLSGRCVNVRSSNGSCIAGWKGGKEAVDGYCTCRMRGGRRVANRAG